MLLGDVNVCVGDAVENMVGRDGVPGRNEIGERMMKLYVKRELMAKNTLLKKGWCT